MPSWTELIDRWEDATAAYAAHRRPGFHQVPGAAAAWDRLRAAEDDLIARLGPGVPAVRQGGRLLTKRWEDTSGYWRLEWNWLHDCPDAEDVAPEPDPANLGWRED